MTLHFIGERIAVVGSGPAAMGFLQQYALHPHSGRREIDVYEGGKWRTPHDITHLKEAKDRGEEVDIVSGVGGAGAPSDGKYNLDFTGRVGGILVREGIIDSTRYRRYLEEGAQMLIRNGGKSDRLFGVRAGSDADAAQQLVQRFGQAGLLLHLFQILHLGTDTGPIIVDHFFRAMRHQGVNILTETLVADVVPDGDKWRVITRDGDEKTYDKVIIAPGRSGAEWFRDLCNRRGIEMTSNGLDVGVRVEFAQSLADHVTQVVYEMKLYGQTPKGLPVRSFCVAPHGHVVYEIYKWAQLMLANGHTNREDLTDCCNFATLVTMRTENPLRELRRISDAVAARSDGRIIVQRLMDLRGQNPSTWESIRAGGLNPTLTDPTAVVPGNLIGVMPDEVLAGISKFLGEMDQVMPGLAQSCVLYGPEGKAYSLRPRCTSDGQMRPGLYVIGDGSGKTRGLNGAIVDGMNTAEHIIGLVS